VSIDLGRGGEEAAIFQLDSPMITEGERGRDIAAQAKERRSGKRVVFS